MPVSSNVLGSLIDDAQRQGRGRVTAVILDADQAEREFRRLAAMWRALSADHAQAFWERVAIEARASWADDRAAQLRKVKDGLYWILDTYLGGREGRVVDGLGAIQGGALVVAGVGIVSISAAAAWIADRMSEASVEKSKAQQMAALSSALDRAKTPEERQQILGVAADIAKSQPGAKASTGWGIALAFVLLALGFGSAWLRGQR